MSQSTDLQLSNQSGAALRAELNLILLAMASGHIGSTQPSYKIKGMMWTDETATPWILKMYDGADWIEIGSFNATTNEFCLTGQADGAVLQGVATIKQIQNCSTTYAATTGSSNAYVLSLAVKPAAYVAGQEFDCQWNHANTGAATLNVVGPSGNLGAKSIKLPDGTDPIAGALPLSGQGKVRYDGTNMVLLSTPAAINIDKAKAYVSFNGTGTVAIKSSFNVSSITDNGAGDYTVNFTTALSDTNYAPVVTTVHSSTGDANLTVGGLASTDGTNPTTKSTTALRIQTRRSSTNEDKSDISVVVFR